MFPTIFQGNASPEQLELMANQMSYADGYDNFEYADGGLENLMEFSGASRPTLGAESDSRIIAFNLTNGSSTTPARVILHAGHRHTENRRVTLVTDSSPSEVQSTFEIEAVRRGLIRDGNFFALANASGTDVTITGSTAGNRSIEDVQNYLKKHSLQVTGVDIQATTENQLFAPIIVRDLSPFQDGKTRSYRPSSATNQDSFQSKRAKFEVPDLVLHDNVEVEYQLLPSETVTMTWFCGAGINLGMLVQNTVNNKAKMRRARR
jgi:hypothetical protein